MTAASRFQAHGGIGLERRADNSRATSCFLGQALAEAALQREIGASGVVNAQPDKVRIAEIELGQIALQVTLGNVMRTREWKKPGLSGGQSCSFARKSPVKDCGADDRDAVGAARRPAHAPSLRHPGIRDLVDAALCP